MAEVDAAKVEIANFRHHYHGLRCKSDDPDPFIRASYRRKALAQSFYAAHTLCEPDATSLIIEKKLLSYYSVVDERGEKSVNNYADAALILASNSGKNEVNKWKSNLRSSRPVSSVVRKLKECPGQCFKLEVAKEDLKVLEDANITDVKVDSTCSRGKFVPKTAGVSVLNVGQKEQFQIGRAPDTQCFHGTNESVLHGNRSFDSASNTEVRTSRWQVLTSNNPHPSESVGLTRSTSNDFESWETGGFGGKGSVSPSASAHNPITFGRKNSGNNPFNVRGVAAVSRNVSGGNIGTGPHSTSTVSRGTGQSSYGSRGWTKSTGTNYNAYKNHEDNQCEIGISSVTASIFKTARDELSIQNQKKFGSRGGGGNSYNVGRGGTGPLKRSLGPRRAGVHGKFVPPIKPTEEDDFGGMFGMKQPGMEMSGESEEEIDERLKNIDPKMVETIRNEIMDVGAPVEWDDIAGLEFAKTTIQEIVVWPLLRPDIFTGLRKPPKGLLLFGPPGTGKTLIGKCIASQSQSTFFSISASSLTSKWIGDGEKMVRALFAVAKVHQPSVVFIDEIDSLLTQRSDTEHESSRRIKTEFLVQLEGAGTGDEERILVVGATNRPQELDEAARRRLVKRLYIPLPEFPARKQIVERLMSNERSSLLSEQIDEIASLTDGYSGADMKNLCQEASLGPIRSISFSAMHQISADQVRPITVDDFKTALQRVRASVSNKDLDAYVQWDKTYGMGNGM